MADSNGVSCGECSGYFEQSACRYIVKGMMAIYYLDSRIGYRARNPDLRGDEW
jgi:hypothetical protein